MKRETFLHALSHPVSVCSYHSQEISKKNKGDVGKEKKNLFADWLFQVLQVLEWSRPLSRINARNSLSSRILFASVWVFKNVKSVMPSRGLTWILFAPSKLFFFIFSRILPPAFILFLRLLSCLHPPILEPHFNLSNHRTFQRGSEIA